MAMEPNNTMNGQLDELDHPGMKGLLAHNDIIFAAGVAAVLVTLLIPLPTAILDILLAVSIAVGISTLIVVLSTRESIEFSTFPSLLLFVTLFRLSLNVASTRLILLNGDAGKIISTFGHFVTGGSMVIGLVVFLILVIIQFIVITKGSERISEVAARFNLDAMPGKQMAIDADLNAGLIGEEQARTRREKIVKESEFYGAMDGASKFIRGDAIAGLIITAINLIGGFLVGMTKGMSAGEAVQTYSILAIGDGLVSQIPAIIISTASGFLISKTTSKSNLSMDLAKQFLARSRPLGIASFLMAGMIFVPGFPKLPFVGLALAMGFLARTLSRFERETQAAKEKPPEAPTEAPVEELLDIDRIAVHVGARLIKAIDPRKKGSISNRIAPLRRKFAREYGLLLPLIRLRDSVTLDANTYEIRINNHVIGSGQLQLDKYLAMDPGTVSQPIDGEAAVEPVFNLPVIWITEDKKTEAEIAGYTVVDPESVLVTHLSEVLKKHSYELLSRDDVQKLVDRLRETQPALVNGVVGDSLPIGLLHRVLQNLLQDGIPIRDLQQILEVLGDNVIRTKDPALLTELARKSLVRAITEMYTDDAGRIIAIVLSPSLEHDLRNNLTVEGEGEGLALPPEQAMNLNQQIAQAWQSAMEQGHEQCTLLCNYQLRPHLAAMLSRQIPQLPVLAYDEIAPGTKIESVGTISTETNQAELATEAIR